MDTTSVWYIVLSLLYALTIAGTILVVVLENENPTKTIAWLLVLIFLPAVGLAFFYIFRQSDRDKKDFSIVYDKLSQAVFSTLSEYGEDYASKSEENRNKISGRYLTLVDMLKRSNSSDVWYGSKIDVITTGKKKFESLMNDLENARHHIHMEYFYFKKDKIGKKIKEILMQKAAEGVEVRFIYENVANFTIAPMYFYEMRKTGVQVVPFTGMFLPLSRRKINNRNHRKVTVIDGNIGYIGGMNIGDEYNQDENWRDTHLKIVGEGVYGLQINFLFDWYTSGEKVFDDYGPYFPPCDNYSDNLLQIAPQSPDSLWESTLMAIVDVVYGATKYVYIQTPYFIPPDSLFTAMQSAALSGVDVRLMVSEKSDSRYLDPAIRSYYEKLLKAGVKIYEHRTKFVHAKTLVSDNYVSVIGSSNMDIRSFETNFEIDAYLYDAALARKSKEIFFSDMKKCREIELEKWLERPWYKKLLESVVRLFSPLL